MAFKIVYKFETFARGECREVVDVRITRKNEFKYFSYVLLLLFLLFFAISIKHEKGWTKEVFWDNKTRVSIFPLNWWKQIRFSGWCILISIIYLNKTIPCVGAIFNITFYIINNLTQILMKVLENLRQTNSVFRYSSQCLHMLHDNMLIHQNS